MDQIGNNAVSVLDLTCFEMQPGTTLIEASAGTGKTYTIQYIVLDLLLKGLELSEILVVTFTELATQELRERLQSFLHEVDAALASPEDASMPLAAVIQRTINRRGIDSVRKIVRRALLHSDEAAIYTIHGFCQRALQENAFAADVAFEAEICADTNSIIQRLVHDFQRRVNFAFSGPPPKGADTKALCLRAEKLAGFLSLAKPSLDRVETLQDSVTVAEDALRSMQTERAAILLEFMSFEGQLSGKSYNTKFFEEFSSLLDQILNAPESIEANIYEKLSTSVITDKFNAKFKKEGKSPQHSFFNSCELLVKHRAGLADRFFNCFDTWFVAAFNQYKLDHGLITYDDMISSLERALRKSPVLNQQLRGRYRAALVDEFQDTDSRQYAIFATLFAKADLDITEPRYFAMIGDPKQSIYGFRGADIESYLAARAGVDARYTLPINYRSEASLIEATNAFFNGSNLGSDSEGESGSESGSGGNQAIEFEPVRAPELKSSKPRLVFSGKVPVPRLYPRRIDSAAEKAEQLMLAAKEQTAQDIADLLRLSQQGHVLIETETPAGIERRALRPGDIAILVDQHREAAELQSALRQHHLLAVLSKAGDVYASDEAAHFLYFLRACLDPREQWIHLLFVSPLYGMSAAQLTQLSDSEHQQAYECFNRLGREWKAGASVGKIWSDFLYEIGARQRILKRPEGERLYTNYLHLGELARELERRDGLSAERLTDQIFERVKAGNSGEASNENPGLVRLESDEDAIQILTLHSSKGLEFPVVFLPSLWQKTVKAKGLKALNPVADSADPDVLLDLKSDEESVRRRSQSEILRLGYVALTRAVHFCVYYNAPDMPQPTAWNANHKYGWFDQWLREQRGDWAAGEAGVTGLLADLSLNAPLEFTAAKPPAALAGRSVGRKIADSYQITSYSSLARAGKALDVGFDPSVPGGAEEALTEAKLPHEDVIGMSDVNERQLLLQRLPGGMHTGTCVHEIMEVCDFTQASKWRKEVESKLEQHFPVGDQKVLDGRVDSVLRLLDVLCEVKGEAGLSLAQLDHAHCMHEMEFYFPVEAVDVGALEAVIESWATRQGLEYTAHGQNALAIDGFLTGSIDLFFEQGGRYYVLDWKTNSPLPGQARDYSSYDRAGLHEQMVHGRYYLQALIYSVAAAQYLRSALRANFDWETHMGGFIYCFVRGLSSNTGWLQSAFSEAEVSGAAQALGLKSVMRKADFHD